MTTQLAGLNLSDTDIQLLLVNCLKPEEISGDSGPQLDRIKELMYWFSRYARGKANGKWLSGHAFELCYYIATMSHNKPTIPSQPAGPVWVKASERLPVRPGDYNARYNFNRCVADFTFGKFISINFRQPTMPILESDINLEWLQWLDETSNTQQVFTREQVEEIVHIWEMEVRSFIESGIPEYEWEELFTKYMNINYPLN